MWLIFLSATILISVTHVYKVRLIFPSLTPFAKWDLLCPVWLILAKGTIFVTCDPCLLSVTHFPYVTHLPIVTHISYCDPFFLVRPIIFKCDPLFLNVTRCDPFCSVWLIFPSAAILISATHVYKVWLIFPILTPFAKCDPFCPVWLIIASATIFVTCDPCL